MSTDDQNPNEILFKSSNLQAARFDPQTNVVEVEFKSGERYSYGNFSAKQMAEWRESKSGGQWFDANVKKKPAAHPVVASSKNPSPTAPPGEKQGEALQRADAETSRKASTTAPMPMSTQKPARAEGEVRFDQESSDVRAQAKRFYEAYIRNSGNKAHDGRECPPFEQLGVPVQSHWAAVVLEARDLAHETGLTPEERTRLLRDAEHQKRRADQAELGANSRLDQAVLDRTKLLDSETGKLRARIAELEGELHRRSVDRPWAKVAQAAEAKAARKAEEASPAAAGDNSVPPQAPGDIAQPPVDDLPGAPDPQLPSPKRT